MFIDIRSATTIAEEIGEERYFEFLKDFLKILPRQLSTRAGRFINMWEMKLWLPGNSRTDFTK